MTTTGESSARIGMIPTNVFIVLLFVGLFLRIIVLPASGFQTDVVMWQNWALKIRHLGIGHAYDPVAFLENSRAPLLLVDHPPVNLYYLTFVAHLPFNSPYIHPVFNAIVKFPGVLFDCFAVLLLAAIARALRYQEHIVRFVVLLYWLNPGFIYHHAFWGLNESMSACVFLGVLLLLLRKRDVVALMLLIASLALKFQMIIFIPIALAFIAFRDGDVGVIPQTMFFLKRVFLQLWKRKSRLLVGLLGGVGVLFYLYIPFIASGRIKAALEVFSGSVGRFPNLTQGAYSPWFILDGLTGFTVPDGLNVLNGISPRMIGVVLFGVATLVNGVVLMRSCITHYRLPMNPLSESQSSSIGITSAERGSASGGKYQLLVLSFALQGFSFFMLPTEMHERYIFYAVTFLPLIAWKSVKDYAFYGALSFTYLVNLVFVYNYFHINWPRATVGHYLIPILNIVCYGYLWKKYLKESSIVEVQMPNQIQSSDQKDAVIP